MKQALVVQPTLFMQVSHQALIYVLEPAFTSSHNTVVSLLCDMLERLYKEFYTVPKTNEPPPTIPPQVSVRADHHQSCLPLTHFVHFSWKAYMTGQVPCSSSFE